MATNYVDYDYWDYGYAEGDTRFVDASGSVTANATLTTFANSIYAGIAIILCDGSLSATAYRIRLNSGQITGFATFTAFGGKLKIATAQINADAYVNVSVTRIRPFAGSVDAFASVSCLGGVLYSGVANIDGVATLTATAYRDRLTLASINCFAVVTSGSIRLRTANPSITASSNVSVNANAIYSANGSINSFITLFSDGHILGDNWDQSQTTINTWIESSVTDNNWIDSSIVVNSWTDRVLLYYVDPDYWENGYVLDASVYWEEKSTSSNTWNKVG